MLYIIVIIVALVIGYEFGPRVTGVARAEYDGAVASLKAEIEKLKAKLP